MARKAAAQVDEKIEPLAEPVVLTEPVEIEITDDVAPPETVVTSPAEPEPPKPQEVLQPIQEDPAIKQRLAEAERALEAERRKNEELIRQNTVGRQQLGNEQQQRFNAQYEAITNALGSAESIIEAAKQEVRSARAEGDIDREVEAQDKWNEAAASKRYLSAQKDQMDQWVEQQKRQPSPQQQRQPTQEELRAEAERAISTFSAPDRVKTWLRNHMEYMMDPVKNNRLQTLHGLIVEQGIEAYSEPYVERMEQLLGLKPTQGNGSGNGAHQPSPALQRQSAPVNVSAPPTREVPSMTTGRAPTPTKVTLNPDEREVASSIAISRGISQAEAEKEYAKQKLRMIREKQQNGG